MVTNKKQQHSKTLSLFLIAIPGIAYLLINNYIPMLGILLAFKVYSFIKGPFLSEWNGLENFTFLFQSDNAWIMVRNTLCYNVVFIILTTATAIFIAILMNEVNKRTISKFFQASLLLPNLVSMVIVSYLVYAFLNPETGLLNNTLEALGFSAINWYSEPKYWPYILPIVNVWKNAGYASIVYIGSISGIDASMYEAARIDGLFYQVPMDSGALYNVTQTIDTYVYRALMVNNDVGMASAAALIQSTVGFILVLSANGLVRKIDKENSLF